MERVRLLTLLCFFGWLVAVSLVRRTVTTLIPGRHTPEDSVWVAKGLLALPPGSVVPAVPVEPLASYRQAALAYGLDGGLFTEPVAWCHDVAKARWWVCCLRFARAAAGQG
jgi:hypothetical protein